jgi:hypothetical protein
VSIIIVSFLIHSVLEKLTRPAPFPKHEKVLDSDKIISKIAFISSLAILKPIRRRKNFDEKSFGSHPDCRRMLGITQSEFCTESKESIFLELCADFLSRESGK